MSRSAKSTTSTEFTMADLNNIIDEVAREGNPLAQYPIGQLRAWADAKVISSAKYVEEVERRKSVAQYEICGELCTCGAFCDRVNDEIQANSGADAFFTLTEQELIDGLKLDGVMP